MDEKVMRELQSRFLAFGVFIKIKYDFAGFCDILGISSQVQKMLCLQADAPCAADAFG